MHAFCAFTDPMKTTVPVTDRIKTAVLVAGHTDEPGEACHRTTCLSALMARMLHLSLTRASRIGQQQGCSLCRKSVTACERLYKNGCAGSRSHPVTWECIPPHHLPIPSKDARAPPVTPSTCHPSVPERIYSQFPAS